MQQRTRLIVLRLVAGCYDLVLVFMLLLTYSALATLLNRGDAILAHHPFYLVHQLLIAGLVVFYFSYFWRTRAQTPGMRAWKLTLVQSKDEGKPTWRQCFARLALFCLMPFFGFLWAAIDRKGQTLYDRFLDLNLLQTR
jgi:uncharacterized RDD family membrane protein YckC